MSEWEGGRRPGVRWRRAGIGVAVVVIAAAAYGTRAMDDLPVDTDAEQPAAEVSEQVDVVVTSPLRADDRWYCPSTHPYRVGPRRVYFPPGHPGHRQLTRTDACFSSAARAAEAGYLLADPPPGTDVVEGMYVEPSPPAAHRDCRTLAEIVGFPVPCPTRLPAPSDGLPCSGSACVFPRPDSRTAGERQRDVGVVIQHRGFSTPQVSPWLGLERDIVFTAVRVADVEGGRLRFLGPQELVSCFPESEVVPRRASVLRTCVDARTWAPGVGGYPLQRHTAAIWRRGNVVYAAGVEGAGPHIDALLLTLIDGIAYVGPT